MNYFARLLNAIRAQLAALTISQRLLIGLLTVVMVATIFFMVMWSAKPAMVALIPQSMTTEEITRAETALKEGGYQYQVSGDKILVPVEQAYAIRGELAAKQALPRDMSSAFHTMIANSSVFKPETMNTREWNLALQEELTKNVQQFPYVEDASVFLAMGQPANLGRSAVPSTATVNVKVKGGETLSMGQVSALVDFVSGAVPGLLRENVKVIGDGMHSYRVPAGNTPMAADLLEFKKTLEDSFEAKLYKLFEHYGDVKIAVNVVPDLSAKTIEEKKVDNKNKATSPLTERTHESNSSDPATAGGQPGVPPNTGFSVDNTTAAKGSSSVTSETQTTNAVEFGHITTLTTMPAGVELKEITASISLPRSYFASVYKRNNPDDKNEPADDKLKAVIAEQEKTVQTAAMAAIGAKAEDQIHVDWFDDGISPRQSPEMVLASAKMMGGSGVVPMVAAYAKQGILALVALAALGMMLMMVRRAVPAGADDEIDASVFSMMGLGGKGKKKTPNVEQLDATDDVFGEANQGEAVLTGIELDDETLASRKMVDEVSTMIKENPENAAALVKRWMGKSK